ncbi:MAG: DUF488 family protein [Actinomycetes bacterium]
MTLWTVGHGTAMQEDFGALLRGADVRHLVDIRTAPGSRRHPHFARDALAEWLPSYDVSYRWEPRLGGFRKPAADSPDVVWRNDAFRGYAGWMRTSEFGAALAELLADAAEPAVVMCSESVWWRCHRRLVADAALLLHDVTVVHLMHDGRLVTHEPTEGVRVRADGLLVYDGGQLAL